MSCLLTQPSKIFEVENLKIGVIGVAAFIVDKVMPPSFADDLKFTTGIKEVADEVVKLKEDGADLVILLSHNGLPQDFELLKQVDGIDICLSAHTHNRIYTALETNRALVIQCGCHGSFMGQMTLYIEDGEITSHQYKLHTIDKSIDENKEMKQLVDNALIDYEDILTNVVGKTDELLHRYTTLNATLDELMHQSACFVTNTDICFSNGWRYGAPIAKGEITENELYNMAPMNPPISVVELTGKEIKEMLEENFTRTFACNPMKQMGGYAKRVFGLQLNMRIENPDGEKIQELLYKGSPLQMNKVYKVSFITVQGVSAKYGKNRKQTDFKMIDSIKLYLKENGAFTPSKNINYRLV